LIHHIVVKANLFLIGGVVRRLRGSYDLARIGGLWNSVPFLGVLFLVPALSLAGIPPLSGFWAKLILVRAGLEAGEIAIVVTALAVSLLTIFSMTKIWSEAFWKSAPAGDAPPEEAPAPRLAPAMVLPIVLLASVTIAIGLAAQPLFDLAVRATEQLLDTTGYVETVLGRVSR
jgi:multicomponent Na+:H+ antiporter subunit D